MSIDPITGLPEELGIWDNLAKESQSIKIRTIKKKFGKVNTVIEGLDSREINIKDVGKQMKSELACGGTAKGGIIELQGDHRQRTKEILVKLGFPESTVEVK